MKKIYYTFIRSPKLFFLSIFFGSTSLWALLEPIITICFPKVNKLLFIIFFVLTSLIIAIIKLFPKNKIQIDLKNTNTNVCIKFGDLFSEKNCIVIGVNEYFDSEIGKPVSEKSLHGQFIKNILGGKRELFDAAVETTLRDERYEENIREIGKSKKYPIGATAILEFGDKKFLLFALAKTNEKYEAYTTPAHLLEALDGLFSKARSECNGHELNIPLIGTGLSRSGIPPKFLIELILISLLKATKQGEITGNVNIIIHDKDFDKIDLNEIKRKWS